MRGLVSALLSCGIALLSACDDTRDPVAGGSSTETSNTLAARFVDDQGTPVAYASVRIRPAGWGSGETIDSILSGGRTRLDTLLDSAGRLKADGFRPGRYSVEVASGALSLRRELGTGQAWVLDTLLRAGGVAGRFVPGWRGVVRVLGTDIEIATDASGAFSRTEIATGIVTLDLRADSGGVVRKARIRTVVPPRAVADLGAVALLVQQEEKTALWKHRERRIVDNTKTGISRDVLDFPLWVPLPDSLAGREDVSDLRVRDESDSARPVEIAASAPGRVGGIWARMRRVDGASKEHSLDVLWGNDEAPSWSDPSSVFDSAAGWRGVWHFDRDGSCAVQGCRELSGGAAVDSGAIGASRRFDGTTSLAAIDAGTLEPSDLSVSLWVNIQDVAGSEARLVWKDSDGQSSLPSWGVLLRKSDGAFKVGFRTRGGPSDSGTFASIATGRWVHVAATIDRHRGTGAKAELFVDGVSSGVFAVDSIAPTPTRGGLIVGKGLVGRIDELRVARVPRVQSWFALERVNVLQSGMLLHP